MRRIKRNRSGKAKNCLSLSIKKAGLSLGFWVILSALLISSVVLAVGTSAKGARLASLEAQRRSLQEENELLTEELVAGTSLKELSTKAESLGMSKPENVVYLIHETVASLP